MGVGPWNCFLNFWKPTKTPTFKVKVHLRVWRFIPSHFLALPEHEMWLPGFSLGSQPCKPSLWSWAQDYGWAWVLYNVTFSPLGYIFCNLQPLDGIILANRMVMSAPKWNNKMAINIIHSTTYPSSLSSLFGKVTFFTSFY